MPSLARGRPAGSSSDLASREGSDLPLYEHLAHPLTRDAQNALHDLPRTHKLDALKARLQKANDMLTDAAVEVNDRLSAKKEWHENARRRREGTMPSSQASGDKDDSEADLKQMQEETDLETRAIDEKLRFVIDARLEIENTEQVLKELDQNAAANRGIIAPTQSTLGASQFQTPRQRRIVAENANGGEDNENTMETDETDAARQAAEDEASQNAAVAEGESAVEMLKRRMGEHRTAYQAESMTQRYASHNDYIHFKGLVHDAKHPGENQPPLPHSSTWFGDGNASGPGRGLTQQPSTGLETQDTPLATQMDEEAEDDGLQVESERISIKCPITLLPMAEPVSSKKCVHSFEREAIMSMLSMSQMRVGGEGRRGGGGKQAIKCPVCEVVLTRDDLHVNPVLVRKIKRIQAAQLAAQNREDSDEENDSGRRGIRPGDLESHEINSSPAPTMRSVKKERMSQAAARRRDASMIPGTQMDAN